MTSDPPAALAGSRRAVFLDVDGTYAHHGVVPRAHEEAVRAVRAAGHLVLLCTGRSASMVPPRLLAAGFDGLVGSAGGYVALDGEVCADVRFPAELAARAVEVLDSHGAAYILEAPDAVYGPVGVDQHLFELARLLRRVQGAGGAVGPEPGAEPEPEPEERGWADVLSALVMAEDLRSASFGKITCFDSPVPVAALVAEIGPDVAGLPSSIPDMGERAGEIFLADVHKARGIQVVVERLGLRREDVIAVGDGLNDLEMVEYAGLGVAIEGADPRLLAVADRTAPPPEQAGLVTLFGELGLL